MDLAEIASSPHARRHPWEQARARAVLSILVEHGLSPRHVLDYGCGDGFTGNRVAKHFDARLTAYDPNFTAELIQQFAEPSIEFTNQRPEDLSRFDLLLLLDVIEHVPDDRDFLSQLIGAGSDLKRNVLITVPAFSQLFTEHDRFLKHYRRYALGDLRAVCSDVGLRRLADGYLFSSLLAPRAASKCAELLRGGGPQQRGIGSWQRGPGVTRAIETALNWDNRLLLSLARKGLKLPGLSAWVLAEVSA